jgi:hypothetical protein
VTDKARKTWSIAAWSVSIALLLLGYLLRDDRHDLSASPASASLMIGAMTVACLWALFVDPRGNVLKPWRSPTRRRLRICTLVATPFAWVAVWVFEAKGPSTYDARVLTMLGAFGLIVIAGLVREPMEVVGTAAAPSPPT